MTMFSRSAQCLLVGLVIITLAGCPSSNVKTNTNAGGASTTGDNTGMNTSTATSPSAETHVLAKSVEDRSVDRWNLIIAGKPEQAYDYLSPGYRSGRTRTEYADLMRNKPVKWTKAEFVEKDCEEDICTLGVLISFKFKMQVSGVGEMQSQQTVTEKWIRSGADWFFLPDSSAR
jgi:hypothetical protein